MEDYEEEYYEEDEAEIRANWEDVFWDDVREGWIENGR